ncbi:DNA replication regulator SLD3-domain-containing protein [Massariosphaeria phaeospora]|uniref:DNA replication regulator SLD3-domain-containing protein n=1 Tax=Massariosphaeria phaeospora TaxID=100035 RepID=A0A7C8I823_9PLEO|nr:DNA replication regulator SLD3-domain-containing protein [Massariosphaeria phaeospora]
MSTYALQTNTMLQHVSRSPAQILGLPTKRDFESKPQLPSKRKRDSLCGLGTFNKLFAIKPCSEAPYDRPATFKPIRIIGRSQLPLTFLDTTPDKEFAANRLFSAQIDVLEQHRVKEDNLPRVLIARYESNKMLYAIERVRHRVYSLCRLAAWLKEKEVSDLWDPSRLQSYPTVCKAEEVEEAVGEESGGDRWWQKAVVEAKQEERPMKSVKVSMLRPEPNHTSLKTELTPQGAVEVGHEAGRADSAMADIPQETTIEVPSPQQQIENLVQQYLEAIYLSKTSLAYFAKGPIARLRSAFTSPEEGAPPTYVLVAFLRSMLLSHKASDKKYREKLPEIIKSIPPGSYSDDETPQAAPKTKKLKKKVKRNREGIYPQEPEIVRRWWTAEMPAVDTYGEETIDQRVKRRIGDLRVREALAQMIIILEITALEALSSYKEPSATTTEGPETQGETQGETQAETQVETQDKPKRRKKKLDDIRVQLDLMLDKLCIWQSIDEVGILDFDTKPSHRGAGDAYRSSNDRLQGFCVEVIIPFYMNRLPEQANMINKKLGGPVHTSPPKRKAAKLPTTTRKSGEAKEPDKKKSRRSLGRVATDTMAQPAQRRSNPSLTRSTTDSALINSIKREGSEAPLAAIPFQRSPSNAARQSMSHLKLLKGREIDLTTPTAAATAKLKQKKRVEEDLKDAIAALKKPNRGLAVGTYVDDIERRGTGLTSKSRKPLNTARRVMHDVQVSATPRATRRMKDMITETPSRYQNPFVRREADVPPSSGFCIPSSAVRQTFSIVPGTIQRSATARARAEPSITETPCKAPNSKTFLASGATRRAIFATPLKNKDSASESMGAPTIQATPSKGSMASSPATKITATPPPILATPTKNDDVAPSFRYAVPSKTTTTPSAVLATHTKGRAATSISEFPVHECSEPARGDEGPSIYEALGWDDDDDFL